ncbi:MAG: hypothetical protein HZB53_09160 [Chloroflexi bacterium]|nr:hypothetical protein [Chloroflexota bacterium]
MKLQLSARQPFNFHSVVHSHGWYQLAPWRFDPEAQTLHVVDRLSDARVVALQVRALGDGVEVESAGRMAQAAQREIAARATWMLMLDADFSEFYALTDREPKLAHCRVKAQGRYLRSPSIWEDIVKVMMTTNIQWGGTKRLVTALVDRYGAPLASDPARKAFPLPATIARSRETTLRKLGIGYRAPYLLQLARGVTAGAIDLDSLADRARPTEQVRKSLLVLPGIGPYAAAMMLGILGRYDYIGVDTEAVSNVSKGFYAGKPVGPKEVEAVFGRWGAYKMLAYWFWDWGGQQQTPMEAYEQQ